MERSIESFVRVVQIATITQLPSYQQQYDKRDNKLAPEKLTTIGGQSYCGGTVGSFFAVEFLQGLRRQIFPAVDLERVIEAISA